MIYQHSTPGIPLALSTKVPRYMGKLMLALSAASIITSFLAKDGDRPKAEKANEVVVKVQKAVAVVDRIKKVREPTALPEQPSTEPLERVLRLMQRFKNTQQTVPIPPPFDPTKPQPLTPT